MNGKGIQISNREFMNEFSELLENSVMQIGKKNDVYFIDLDCTNNWTEVGTNEDLTYQLNLLMEDFKS